MSVVLKSILSWLCFPLYVVQGLAVRRRSMRLSPPNEGARSGQIGAGKPEAVIMVVGDSSAAGVGLDHTSETIAPQLAAQWHEQEQKTVAWQMSGHNSAVSGQIRDHVVPHLAAQSQYGAYTHIVLMLGANDMKNWCTVPRWKKDFGGLLYALRAKYPEAKIYWHQIIDVSQVPLLPQPLAWIMNLRVGLFNRKGTQLCLERGVVCVPALAEIKLEGYCKDGFHANQWGYKMWAQHLLNHFDYEPRSSPAVKDFL